ncbi:hypothetical protein SAMN05216242_10130 [Thauera chlorobenzoica]|nr:hypothetical protein SAMN05216242_10130 [Thauera chlorobenzoica]
MPVHTFPDAAVLAILLAVADTVLARAKKAKSRRKPT